MFQSQAVTQRRNPFAEAPSFLPLTPGHTSPPDQCFIGGPQPGATAAAAAPVLSHWVDDGVAKPATRSGGSISPTRQAPPQNSESAAEEGSFGLGPQRSGHHTTIPSAYYTAPIPGTKETEIEQKGMPKQWRIEGHGAFVIVTPKQQSLSIDMDNSMTSPYQIDAQGDSPRGHSDVDNIGTGWPRTGPCAGEEEHVTPFEDIHSCVNTCTKPQPRIPITKLSQHQADYLESSGVILGPPGPDKVRRPLVKDGRVVVRHQLQFPDGTSPDPDTYNDRVRNSGDSMANRGMSVVTINAQTGGASRGLSGDSQGRYNLEGSSHQAAAAAVSQFGFVTVYLHAENSLVNRTGRIQVSKAEFTQARIDLSVGTQYEKWLGEGGGLILQRALYLAGAIQ